MDKYINKDNIEKSRANDEGVEYHPLLPFLPENAKVLFLGSFPPQMKRWCMNFYYPNFINDHWRIEGLLFFGNKDYFVDNAEKSFKMDAIVEFLNSVGIAFYDSATVVRRLMDNASDKFLEIVEPTDINGLLKALPLCRVVVTTGEKATRAVCDYFHILETPKVGGYVQVPNTEVVLYRLPSSSRAYPMSIEKKASFYREMFVFSGIL